VVSKDRARTTVAIGARSTSRAEVEPFLAVGAAMGRDDDGTLGAGVDAGVVASWLYGYSAKKDGCTKMPVARPMAEATRQPNQSQARTA
jgi:hypothetical protein